MAVYAIKMTGEEYFAGTGKPTNVKPTDTIILFMDIDHRKVSVRQMRNEKFVDTWESNYDHATAAIIKQAGAEVMPFRMPHWRCNVCNKVVAYSDVTTDTTERADAPNDFCSNHSFRVDMTKSGGVSWISYDWSEILETIRRDFPYAVVGDQWVYIGNKMYRKVIWGSTRDGGPDVIESWVGEIIVEGPCRC